MSFNVAAKPPIVVASTSALVTALKQAKGGEIILLAPGSYDPVRIENLVFADRVVVSSLDPAKPAVLTGLRIQNVQGLTVSGMEAFAPAGGGNNPFLVRDSRDVHLEHWTVRGDPSAARIDQVGAIGLTGSNNVSVTGSTFSNLFYGVVHSGSDGVLIASNAIRDVRMDGVRGGGSDHVRVSRNYFSGFNPILASDHADAIQFWTANATKPTLNILVDGNIAVRGDGRPMQGVFVKDEGKVGYQGLTIVDNLIVGGHFHGISVNGASDVAVVGNSVFAFPDQHSWIYAVNVDRWASSGNTAFKFHGSALSGRLAVDDLLAPPLLDGGKALLAGLEKLAPEAAGSSEPQRLLGGSAADLLVGRAGDDTLSGGGGDDTLQGGRGDDVLEGGPGADVFVFRPGFGNDVVLDYQPGVDVLDFLAFSAAGIGHTVDWSTGQAVITFETGDTLVLLGAPHAVDVCPVVVIGGG